MQVYKIGALLRRARIEKKLSIVDMCEGICSKQMASLIETEQRVAHWKMIDSLFSRIGEKTPFNIIVMTKEEAERHILETKIRERISSGNAEIKEFLDEYRIGKMTKLEEQFFKFYSIVYENRNFDKNDWAVTEFTEALKFTIPNYDIKESFPKQTLLSNMELVILNNIARQQYNCGEKKAGFSLMKKLYKYTKSYWMSAQENVKTQVMILFNLEDWSDEEPVLWNDALKMAEEGIELCLKYNKLTYFPYHLFAKGYYLSKLGDKEQGKKVLQDSLMMITKMFDLNFAKNNIPNLNNEFNFDFDITYFS